MRLLILDHVVGSRWSELTIFLPRYLAWCSHEGYEEGNAGDPLSYLRRKARREVRAWHRPAADRSSSRSATVSGG